MNQLPPFALAMMDAPPLISKISVCRTKDVTSDAGSFTFEDGTSGNIVKIYGDVRCFFRCLATYLLGELQKKANEQIAEYLNWNEKKETLLIYYGPKS